MKRRFPAQDSHSGFSEGCVSSTMGHLQAEEGCWQALEPANLLPTFLEGLRRELSSVLTVSPTPENPSPIPLALSSLLFALAAPDLGIAVPVQAPSVSAVSPIMPAVSRSADSSSELIEAVHCQAEAEGTSTQQHGAPSSEVGAARTSQERQAVGTAAGATDGLLVGVSIRSEEDVAMKVLVGADSFPQQLRLDGGEMDLPAGMSESAAESPTRPQAAERMDEAIQQGLQLWTPPKEPNSGEAHEHPAEDNSLEVLSSVGRSLEPESPISEADQAHMQPDIGREDAPPHKSEAGQVFESREPDGGEVVGEEAQETGSQQTANGIRSSNGPAAQQAEQSSGRRKWAFKLGRAARAPDALTGMEASSRADVAPAAAAGTGAPRNGGVRKQLARFGRSKASVSISDEAPISALEADAAVRASASVKEKAQAVEELPAVVLNAGEEPVQQSTGGAIDARRSQSEAATGNQPAKRGFLKKQLTRFGRARGVSEGAREGISAGSGTSHQQGGGKSHSARIPVLGSIRSPKQPAQGPGSDQVISATAPCHAC